MGVARTDRLHQDKAPDVRSPFQRDRDRILYSSAFRRLAEVTQVVSSEEGHVFHNRLTHSLEVAQFARRLAERLIKEQTDIAEKLGGVDPDLVEAAALAHDIGHPPFGHIAEKQLNSLVEKSDLMDGFEGNAQTFRIICNLALISAKHFGLNLTRATLGAVLKYPWLRSTSGAHHFKWGAYHSESSELAWAREGFDAWDERRCAEAELMDWADDVTYAVHDMIDFYRAGLIPLEKLAPLFDESERRRFCTEVFLRHAQSGLALPFPKDQLEAAFLGLTELLPIDHKYEGKREDRAKLRSVSSTLITRYITTVRLHYPVNKTDRRVMIDPDSQKEVFMLKQLTWHYVILHPSLAIQQHGQKKIISDLFEIFYTAAKKHDFTIFPMEVREDLIRKIDDSEYATRTVADLIAGMTEHQVKNLHARLTGAQLGSVLDPI